MSGKAAADPDWWVSSLVDSPGTSPERGPMRSTPDWWRTIQHKAVGKRAPNPNQQLLSSPEPARCYSLAPAWWAGFRASSTAPDNH